MVHPDNGLSVGSKKNGLSSLEKVWRNLMYMLLSERKLHTLKGYIEYDSKYMTFKKRQNTGDRNKLVAAGTEQKGFLRR